jgi:hypothetical protein
MYLVFGEINGTNFFVVIRGVSTMDITSVQEEELTKEVFFTKT